VAAGARMEQLTRDVLTYSKVARSELPLNPVHLDQVVQAILTSNPQLHPPKANVTVQHPLWMSLEIVASLTSRIQPSG